MDEWVDEIIVDEDGIVLDDDVSKYEQHEERCRLEAVVRKVADAIGSKKRDVWEEYSEGLVRPTQISLLDFEDMARKGGYVPYLIKPGEMPIRLTDGYWWMIGGHPTDREYQPIAEVLKIEAQKEQAVTLKVWFEGDEVKMKVMK